jgi:glucosamine kinase
MNPIYLFEAGGTKTTLIVDPCKEASAFRSPKEGDNFEKAMQSAIGQLADKPIIYGLPGFNPNRYSEDFETALQADVRIPKDARVFFYGSGLLEEANKQKVRDIFTRLYEIQVAVYDDVTGAARAGLGNKAGLVAIMGTGGGVAYFDGGKVVHRNGGYGYLIDDYGGGLELGKILLSAWLNGDLPAVLSAEIQAFVKVPRDQFIYRYYESKDLALLASVVKLLPAHLHIPAVNELVREYFITFFKRHAAPLKQKYQQDQLFVIGSIGVHFSEVIRNSAAALQLVITGFDDQPALALLAFHRRSTTI